MKHTVMSNDVRNDLGELTTGNQLIEEAECERLMDISAEKSEGWRVSFEIKAKRSARSVKR